MCIPGKSPSVVNNTTTTAPSPSAIPSVQAATNVQLGGDAADGALRGAAQLGRLKLRIGGAKSQAPKAATGKPPLNNLQQQDGGGNPAATNPVGTGGFPYRGFTFGGADGGQAL